MVKDHFTIDEVAEILDIYEVSAKELLNGIISFTSDELQELADFKGLRMEELTL